MNDKPKFIFSDSICDGIKNHKKNENKRRNFMLNTEIFLPERATECDRKILYDVYNNVQFDFGFTKSQNDLKHKWASIMMRMENVILHGVSVEFSDTKYNLHGAVDMILSFENLNIKSIAMVRQANNEMMQKIKENGPIKRDVITDIIYMWLSEIPNAIMIYESENEEVEVFHVTPYNPIINSAKKKFFNLLNHRVSEKMIERSYSKVSHECETCKYKTKCWGGKNE